MRRRGVNSLFLIRYSSTVDFPEKRVPIRAMNIWVTQLLDSEKSGRPVNTRSCLRNIQVKADLNSSLSAMVSLIDTAPSQPTAKEHEMRAECKVDHCGQQCGA